MTTWTNDALNTISAAEELEISSLRRDGTLRKPRTIWVVRLDRDLYVRSVNGRGSDWFRGTQTKHEGRIQAGGVEQDVRFEDVDAGDAIHDRIDAEYRRKYRRYAANIVNSVLSQTARAATLRLIPRAAGD